MNAMLAIGVVLDLVATVFVCMSEYADTLGPVYIGAAVLLLVGTTMVALGRRRAGSTVVLIASLPYLPLGLFGVLGAQQVRARLMQEVLEGDDLDPV